MALKIKELLTNVLKSIVLRSNPIMEGEMKTTDGFVVVGSGQATSTTVPNLLNEVRYTSGSMGSINITSSYTNNDVTIATGWYNYCYIPHRSGGKNGKANRDNCDYGNLLLTGMTVANAQYLIRFVGGSIANVYKFGIADTVTSSSLTISTTTNYSGTVYYQKRDRVVIVSFLVTCNSPVRWTSGSIVSGLPGTYDSKEVYGGLCGVNSDSVSVAIQSDGGVKFGGGVAGKTYTGTAYYISSS